MYRINLYQIYKVRYIGKYKLIEFVIIVFSKKYNIVQFSICYYTFIFFTKYLYNIE